MTVNPFDAMPDMKFSSVSNFVTAAVVGSASIVVF
jgi:predicted transcriptional regulator